MEFLKEKLLKSWVTEILKIQMIDREDLNRFNFFQLECFFNDKPFPEFCKESL